MIENKNVLVFGATGNVGGAAARALLKRGWKVRAVTRFPESAKAQVLAQLGAQVVQADMEDRPSLDAAFQGLQRVFSVQNWMTSGVDGEIRQGKLVADAARDAGVQHLVYGSAGTGEPNSGIPHFDNKLVVESYMRELDLPITILRPTPFMELLSEKEFFPALATWGAEPKVVGWDTPIPWVAVRDIGMAVANAFEDPQTWIGRDINLLGDVKTLAECKAVFAEVHGKKPFGVPLPLWLFRKMTGDEFIQMWQWLVDLAAEAGESGYWEMAETSRQLCPDMLDMHSWLMLKSNGAAS